MSDEQKTKGQLIKELDALRSKLTRPEAVSIRPPRFELNTKIELTGNVDIVEAQGVNLSKEGICFELPETLTFEMRFDFGEEVREHKAKLIWAKHLPEGKFRMGLKFIE